jgi:hypothetical protein
MAGLPAERVAAARLAGMQGLARAAASAAGDAWSRVDPGDVVRSWVRLLGRPLAALIGAQTIAARTADAYVDEALGAQDVDAEPAGRVVAGRLAGVASDGRQLESLLQQPAIRTLQAIGAGAAPGDALQVGRLSLDMIVRTQVADAGRTATGVALAARGVGYVRMLNPPSCSRCAILAGRFYRWNAGFSRHPRCDCIHVPTTEGRAARLRSDPRSYFDSLTRTDQDRTFTRAGAEAIRDGADMSQVVNARRGMTPAGTTTESTGRRGVARPGRLMPEEIYRRAQGDRTEALRLLELHGYLIRRPAVAVAPPVRTRAPEPAAPVATPRPAPPAAFTRTTLTKGDLDAVEAQRALSFAEAKLRRATTDAERQAVQDKIVNLRERAARSGTASGYNWSAPSWQVPAGTRITGTPDAAVLHAHADSRTHASIPAGLRTDLVGELKRQAEVAPRALLELREVEALARFDTVKLGDALAYYTPSQRRIVFNPEWATNRASIESSCSSGVTTGWWTRRGSDRSGAAGVLAHEFGHHVGRRAVASAGYEQTVALAATFDEALQAGGVLRAAVQGGKEFLDAVDEWLDAADHRTRTQQRISRYGGTNVHELMAEVWHEYSTTGVQARPHIRAMGEALRDLSEASGVIRQ